MAGRKISVIAEDRVSAREICFPLFLHGFLLSHLGFEHLKLLQGKPWIFNYPGPQLGLISITTPGRCWGVFAVLVTSNNPWP